MLHHQVDRPHRFRHADEAAAVVLPYMKREALMMIVMEGAEALVLRNSETESLGDPLNGEVAELLYLKSVHHFDFDFPVRYSSVFE